MDEQEVAGRIERLEQLLELLEETPGATAASGIEAVGLLSAVYGEALARMARLTAQREPPLLADMAADELVGHLLGLHGVHPGGVVARVELALDEVRPYARSHGGDIELVSIEDGTAVVRLSGTCDGCASSQATMAALVRDAVLGSVPELIGVEALAPTAPSHPAPGAHPPAPVAITGRSAADPL